MIYVLLEHQSTHDPLMALRLLLYLADLWAGQRREAEDAGVPAGQIRIYPIIPLVFYTGESGWTTPLDLAHLMALPTELQRFVPQWDTLFLNLHQTPPEALTQFTTAVGYALRVMQAEGLPFAELERVIQTVMAGLGELSEEQAGQWARVAWFILSLAYHRRGGVEYNVLSAEILAATRASKFKNRAEVEEMAQTMAQVHIEEGLRIGQAQGIEIGQAQGIEIGRIQTLRQVLSNMLTTRFGELPPAVTRSIEVAQKEQLEGWVSLAITAASLEAVGIAPPQ
jgi:hypothetical protein